MGQQVAKNEAKLSSVTENVARYIAEKGISIQNLANAIGITDQVLYRSLGNTNSSKRNLRDVEFLAICKFLEVDPMRFYDED